MIIDHSCPTPATRWGTATGERKEKGQMSDQCPRGSESKGNVSRTTATGLDSSTAIHPRLPGISSSCTSGIIRTFLDVLSFVEVSQTLENLLFWFILPGPHCPGLSPIHFWDCRERCLIFSELAQVCECKTIGCSFRRNFLEIVNQPCESDWAPMCAVNSSACSELAMNIYEHRWSLAPASWG